MSTYYTTLTSAGITKLAAAQTGDPLQLTHLAVGDGTPDATRQALTHEVWRGALNDLRVDPNNTGWVLAEARLPPDIGGFSVTEAVILDADGGIFAVANYPETYKAAMSEGVAHELVVRLILAVGNAANVTLTVDPSVVLATREHVEGTLRDAMLRMATTETHLAGCLTRVLHREITPLLQ